MIKLNATFGQWDVESRRVYVEVNNNRSEVVTLKPGKSETVRLNWLSGMEEPPAALKIEVVDPDTGEVVSKRNVTVRLLM